MVTIEEQAMTVLNFDLLDGNDPVQFSVKPDDADRFQAFMERCTETIKKEEGSSCLTSGYAHLSKQQLLDFGINVFAIDLLAESFLKLPKIPDNFAIFFPVNRADCAEYTGINVRIEAVKK